MQQRRLGRLTIGIAVAGLLATAVPAAAGPGGEADRGRSGDAAEHWTADRRAAAVPRDLFLDDAGNAWIRGGAGLEPYGAGGAAGQLTAEPRKGPPGGGGGGGGADTGPTTISDRSPADGATVGASAAFSATVADPDGVRSVTFVVTYPSGSTQSFAGSADGDVWSVTLNGFTDGQWGWHVVVKDGAKKGGNTTTSSTFAFTVDTGGGGDPGGGTNAVRWTDGGTVQTAAGRIYFEMPTNRKARRWAGYVCSGTVVTEAATGVSLVLTAAHCIYDDANKYFARNVLFIPDQDGTTGSGTDTNCGNDPIGCWEPSHGVVDVDWTTRTFPDNVEWDYGFYVVPDAGAHSGAPASSDALADATGSLDIDFFLPEVGDEVLAMGYSYDDDPWFMACTDPLGAVDAVNWWLDTCALTGGSSGGPWLQPGSGGNGPVMSVNSWGYTTRDGMAGPRLDTSTASCVFSAAQASSADLAVAC